MIKPFIKVIREETLIKDNPFNLSKIYIQKFKEKYELPKDEREEIPPYGVSLEINLNKDVKLSIEVSKYYLNYDLDNWFITTFVIDKHTFELNVKFNSNGKLSNVVLHQWLDHADFANGDEWDYAYYLTTDEVLKVKTIDM